MRPFYYMRAVIQRVAYASVKVDGKTVGKVGKGLMVLLGVARGDTEQCADYLAGKTAEMRIFSDEDDKMNLSVSDVDGKILVVSNFTLCADCRKGRRPAFVKAAGPEEAERLYNRFSEKLREKGLEVETGIFGADMKVEILNDGPVTIILDTNEMLA